MPLVLRRRARSPSTWPAGRRRWCSTSATSGTVRVEGPGALERLQAALTNDLTKVGPGRAQYTHLLDEARCVGARRHHRVVGRRGALRRHAERLEHRPGGGRDRRRGRHRQPGDPRRAGPDGPDAARHHRARGRGRRSLPGRRRPTVAGADVHRGRHRLHGRGRRRAGGARRRGAGGVGGAAGRRAASRPGSGRATRCGSRRPAAARPRAGPRHHAAAGRARAGWWPGTSPAGSGAGSAGRRAGARRRPAAARARRRGPAPARGPSRRCWSTARRWARSPAATSRRCSATASPSAFLPPEVDEGAEVAIDVRGTRSRRRSCRPLRHPLTRPRPGNRSDVDSRHVCGQVRAGTEGRAGARATVSGRRRHSCRGGLRRRSPGRPSRPSPGGGTGPRSSPRRWPRS